MACNHPNHSSTWWWLCDQDAFRLVELCGVLDVVGRGAEGHTTDPRSLLFPVACLRCL